MPLYWSYLYNSIIQYYHLLHLFLKVFIEDYEGRGLFTQCLAEVEILRRKRKRTLHVTTIIDATPLTIQSSGENDDDESRNAAPMGSVVVVEAEGEATVGQLKQRLLEHFGLLSGWPDSPGSGSGSAMASTRLRIATDDILGGGSNGAGMMTSALFGEVLADEALSLDEAKVKDGLKLVLEKGMRAGRDEVTLRFKAIVGNDPTTASFAFPSSTTGRNNGKSTAVDELERRPPHACRELEVTIKESASVFDLKAAMCAVALAEGALVLPPQHAEAIVTAAEAPDTTTAASNAANQAQATAAKAAKQAAAAESKVATLQGKKKKDARAAANAAAEKAAAAAARAEELRVEEATVKAAAAAAASAAAEDPAVLLAKQRRLRLTNWAEEPGALVEETKEGQNKAKSSSSSNGGAGGVGSSSNSNSETLALHQTASALTKAATEADRLVGTLQGKRKKEARVAAALAAEKAAAAAAAAATAEAKDAAQREADRTAGGWAARAASLAPMTVKEALLGGDGGRNSTSAAATSASAVHDVLWLEEGRVPLKGELKVSVLLWQPCGVTTVPLPPPPEADEVIGASTVEELSAELSACTVSNSVSRSISDPDSASSTSSSSSLVSTPQQHRRQYSQDTRAIQESCYVKVAEVEVHATNSLAQLCAAVALQLTAPAARSSLTGAAGTLAARVADTARRAEEEEEERATAAAVTTTEAAGAIPTSVLPADGANTANASTTTNSSSSSGAAPASRGVSATMAATAAAAAAAAQHLNFEASETSAALEVYLKSGARCFRLRELRVDEQLPGKWLGNDTASRASPSSGGSSSGIGSLIDASAVAHARTLGLTTTLERLQVKTERPLVLVPVSADIDEHEESDSIGCGVGSGEDGSGSLAMGYTAAEATSTGGLVQSARAWMPTWLGGSDETATTSNTTSTAVTTGAAGEQTLLSGVMRLPPSTASYVDVWVTRRDDGRAAYGVASSLEWPPKRCLVTATTAAGAPTFDQFFTAVAAAAGVPSEHAVLARHHDQATWVVLAADMTSSRAKKGSKKINKSSSGAGLGTRSTSSSSSSSSSSRSSTTTAATVATVKSSSGTRSVTQSPFYVQHGDLIGVIDRRVVATSIAAGGASGVDEEPPLEGTERKEERQWASLSPATSSTWARAFDTPADVEVREVAAAAAAAKRAAAAASATAGGATRNDGGKKKIKANIKEIALEIGTAGDWDGESDDDDESSDEEEESDEEHVYGTQNKSS